MSRMEEWREGKRGKKSRWEGRRGEGRRMTRGEEKGGEERGERGEERREEMGEETEPAADWRRRRWHRCAPYGPREPPEGDVAGGPEGVVRRGCSTHSAHPLLRTPLSIHVFTPRFCF